MPSLTKLRRLKLKTLNATVVDLLSELIFSGQIGAGERVNESELVRQLEISRSPIREALHTLEEQGIVTNKPRRGTFVIKLTQQDVQKINTTRLVLESRALCLCKQNFDSKLEQELRQMVEKLDGTDPSLEISTVRRIDLQFHRAIWDHCGDEYLAAALVRLTAPLFVYAAETEKKGQGRIRPSHGPFFQWLQGQSQQTAEEVVLEHLRAGYSFEPGRDHESGVQRVQRGENS